MIIIYDSDNVCVGARRWSYKEKKKTIVQEEHQEKKENKENKETQKNPKKTLEAIFR